MKKSMFSKLLIVLLLVFTTSVSFALAPLCSSYFVEERQTLNQYRHSAKILSEKVLAPRFSNPQYEAMAAKTWNGVKGPEVLQAMLPEGVTFINHSLLGANEDGVVKTSTGSLVHLRAKLGESGTNIGVNINALKSNFNRDVKSLVREEAQAVVVFIHGGGTKTTGHHVAASLMNWFNVRNVDVVSMDMPWHGEGTRGSFDSVKSSLEEMRELVKKYVAPAGKPIILVGHSMGGVVSDLYMRMYPNDKLFSAVAPLSTVADALPGGTAAEKLIHEALIAEKNKTNEKIPASERDLGEMLARQNKLSPTCGMFCQVLMFGIDWKMPSHKGSEYLPALYLIGEGDGLYQGFEASFKASVAGLANAELKIFDQRRDIKDKEGKLTSVGHLIFDHKPRIDFAEDLPLSVRQSILSGQIKEPEFNRLRAEGKLILAAEFKYEDISEPETFVLLKNFISKVTKKELAKVKIDNAPIDLVMQAYANNLAFREFAKTYVFQNLKATEKAALLGQEMQNIAQAVKKLNSLKKEKGQLSAEEQKQIDALNLKHKELISILNLKGVVNAENSTRYKELQEQLKNVNTVQVPALTAERKQVRTLYDEKNSLISRAEKLIAEHQVQLTSPELSNMVKVKERAFKLMMEQDAKVRDLTNAYLVASHSNGQFTKNMFENLPANTIKEFDKFEKIAELYQKILRKYEQTVLREAQLGHLIYTGETDSKSNIESKVHEAANEIYRLNAENQQNLAKLEELDKQMTKIANLSFKIEKEMAQLTGGDYFQPEYYTVQRLLSQSLSEARQNKDQISSLLQKIWADWQKIWAVRTAESSETADLN